MSKPDFVNGMFVNKPHEKAPDFIKLVLGFHVNDFIAWLSNQPQDASGFMEKKIQVKESTKGNIYAAVDNYVPRTEEPPPADSEPPF